MTMQQSEIASRDAKKLTRFIRTLSLFKVPLLGVCRPRVVEMSASRACVELPLGFMTKNHLGSMYFGALAMGAELSVALRLLQRMKDEKLAIAFIFKDFQCDFLKRAETSVQFVTDQVVAVDNLIDTVLASSDRHNGQFEGYAISATSGEKLMTYRITISMKRFSREK